MAGIGFTLPYLPLYLGQEGTSDRAIGLVSTLAALAGLVQYPVGRWSDRLGRRKPFLVGALAALAAATFLLRVAHGAVWLSALVVLFAENGHEAIAALEANPDADLVLMDIMMPELDGYEATRRIRADERFAKLPIISLTAKAMKGDREKSIESGASDYITKPVETDQLLSLMRVWLYQ